MFLKLSIITKKYPYLLLPAPIWILIVLLLLFFLFAMVGGPMILVTILTPGLLLFSPFPAVSLVVCSKLSPILKYSIAIVLYVFLYTLTLMLTAVMPWLFYMLMRG